MVRSVFKAKGDAPLYANFLVAEGWQVNQALDFLRSLLPGCAGVITFEDYEQLENLLMDMAEFIEGRAYRYDVRRYDIMGYPQFEILEVYCNGRKTLSACEKNAD